MYMTPEELAKEDPKTLQKYMQMGDKSPLPLGAVKMALMMQDKLRMNARAQQARAQGNGNPNKPTTIVDRIAEAVKQKIQSEPSPQQMAGIGAVPIPNVMQEQNFAGGGIVAFAKGEDVVGQEQPPEKKPVPPALGTSAVSRGLQERLERDLQRIEEERKGLGRVDPYTGEELSSMYGKEYSAAEERVKPFLDRMRALEESGRPDIPGMEKRSERAARQAMFSRMMQTRGAGFGAGIAGFGAALDEKQRQEEKGLASIDAAKKAHVASQRLMVQAEMEANKGNSEAARRLVDAANAAKKAEVADNRNAHRELGRNYDRVNDIYEANVRAEQQAAATAQRERAAELRAETDRLRIEAAIAKAGRGGGGGGGGSGGEEDARWHNRQMAMEYRKILSDVNHPARADLLREIKARPEYQAASAEGKRAIKEEGFRKVLPYFAEQYVRQNYGKTPFSGATESRSALAGPSVPSVAPPSGTGISWSSIK
jgi:hypothetical protein